MAVRVSALGPAKETAGGGDSDIGVHALDAALYLLAIILERFQRGLPKFVRGLGEGGW